jgi:hypothetical protein
MEILNQPVVFGLKAQGHIPTVESMIKNGSTWEEIGKKINWDGETACRHYMWHLQAENEALLKSKVGIEGWLLNTRNDGTFIFRVYDENKKYKDYELKFDDLKIIINDKRCKLENGNLAT